MNYYIMKPEGNVRNVTEIRENYQDPNDFPPRRPIIHKLVDTLEKVYMYIGTKNSSYSQKHYLCPLNCPLLL